MTTHPIPLQVIPQYGSRTRGQIEIFITELTLPTHVDGRRSPLTHMCHSFLSVSRNNLPTLFEIIDVVFYCCSKNRLQYANITVRPFSIHEFLTFH